MLIISTQCFPPIIGGIESLIFSLAREFNANGEKVDVYADATHTNKSTPFDKTQPFNIRRIGGLKPLRRILKAQQICLQSNKYKNDGLVLLADTWKSLEHINPSHFKRVSCLAHGAEFPQDPKDRKRKRIEKSLGKADVIVCNSSYTATRVGQFVEKSKIVTVTPGIIKPEENPEITKPISLLLEQHELVLVTVARLEKRKGHERIIQTLPSLIGECPTLKYIIIGDGPCRTELENEVKKLGLHKNVDFVGSLTGVEKNAYLINSDIFVMPGIKDKDNVEGFGIAYVEAAYYGVPGVANDVGGAAEAVLHNNTGLVCDANDMMQLKESLYRLIKEPKYRVALGENARKHAAANLWPSKINAYAKYILAP